MAYPTGVGLALAMAILTAGAKIQIRSVALTEDAGSLLFDFSRTRLLCRSRVHHLCDTCGGPQGQGAKAVNGLVTVEIKVFLGVAFAKFLMCAPIANAIKES